MSASRTAALSSLLKGLLAAIAITLIGMLLIAAVALFARPSDGLLTALNQILKFLAILIGTRAAVGRGGSRGFVTGAALALIYMTLGYALYATLGGGAHSTGLMLGEMLLGAAVGGFIGALFANLRPKSRRARL